MKSDNMKLLNNNFRLFSYIYKNTFFTLAITLILSVILIIMGIILNGFDYINVFIHSYLPYIVLAIVFVETTITVIEVFVKYTIWYDKNRLVVEIQNHQRYMVDCKTLISISKFDYFNKLIRAKIRPLWITFWHEDKKIAIRILLNEEDLELIYFEFKSFCT